MLRASRRQTLLIALFLFLVVVFVTTFRMGVVRGTSMEPTYLDGQVVLVRREGWLHPPLHRGDVVLVSNQRDVIIKRVFALPGDEIFPNWIPNVLERSFENNLTDYYEQQTVSTPQGKVTHYYVPKNFIVVIGDNLPVSEDSRVFGPVSFRDVLGVVVNALPAPYKAGPAPVTNFDNTPSDSPRRPFRRNETP